MTLPIHITSDHALVIPFSFNRLKRRFPYVDNRVMSMQYRGNAELIAHISETHDITLAEAKEEFTDFLFTETLCQEVLGPRHSDE